jgi:hypothetical protein
VDGFGRLWASGYETQQVQVFDPATGGLRSLTPTHPVITGSSDVIYQVSAFSRLGVPYVAFLAQDELGGNGRPIYYGHAPAADIIVTSSYSTWAAAQFGAGNLSPSTEASLWGTAADPDADGRPNLLEYAFGSPPLLPVQDADMDTHASQGSGRAQITFPRRPGATDLRYTVEATGTLAPGSWSALASSDSGDLTEAVSNAAATEVCAASGAILVTVTDLVSEAGAPRRFLRVRVERITPP